jgi:hypothetical protein
MRFWFRRVLVTLAILIPGQSLAQATTDMDPRPLKRDEIGVVFMPHGADSTWNANMQAALAPLSVHYVTANAYSMADADKVEAALRELEAKGMRAAVIVRIFSLESSFRTATEYMIGLGPDRQQDAHAGHHMSGSGSRGHYMSPPRRIDTPLQVVTTGGMEAHPLLGEAMADRVRALSTHPERETVILTGHGAAADADDAHWMKNLAVIADIIRKVTGLPFRDIKMGTWREDWPEKRDASVARIRRLVEEAGQDGGTALVIPVRTIGQGPEDRWLEGLEYRLGEGFAPHPAFVKWVASEIEEGVAELLYDR